MAVKELVPGFEHPLFSDNPPILSEWSEATDKHPVSGSFFADKSGQPGYSKIGLAGSGVPLAKDYGEVLDLSPNRSSPCLRKCGKSSL